MTDQLMLREMDPEMDKNFVLASWVNKMANHGTLLGDSVDFMRRNAIYQYIFERVINESTVIVLCNPDFMYQIVGYCVFKRDESKSSACIHFLYVKEIYQKNGFGSQMLAVATNGVNRISYTCQTKLINDLILKKHLNGKVDWVPQKLLSKHGPFLSREEELEIEERQNGEQ